MTPSAQTTNQEERKNSQKRSNSEQIILYCLSIRTQNLGLRELDLVPSPKRGSGKTALITALFKIVSNDEHKSSIYDEFGDILRNVGPTKKLGIFKERRFGCSVEDGDLITRIKQLAITILRDAP